MTPEQTIILLVVLLILLIVVVAVGIFLLFKKEKKHQDIHGLSNDQLLNLLTSANDKISDKLKEQSLESLKTLNEFQNKIKEDFDRVNNRVDERLEKINKDVNAHLQSNAEVTGKTIKEISTELGKVTVAQQQITELQGGVIDLKKVLEGNQTRGQYGERTLHLILENVFGETKMYAEQVEINTKDGSIRPDAVVFVPDPNSKVCIDSKFPYQNYERLVKAKENERSVYASEFARDVKKHIDTIAGKYIIKNETAAFAFMFIPNDAIFIYLHNEADKIIDYAEKKKVILASPSTLYPFLSTIFTVNIDHKRKTEIDKIIQSLDKVGKSFQNLEEAWDGYLTTYETLSKKVTLVSSRLEKAHGDMEKISGLAVEEERLTVESK